MRNPEMMTMSWGEDDDYDDGSPDSGKSRDWDMEPGDPGWLGDDEGHPDGED